MTLEERKAQEIRAANEIAKYELAKTDWYVTRYSEIQTPIPESIVAHRAAIRQKHDTVVNAVNACVTEDDFNALFEIPTDDEGNFTGYAIIENWPTL